MKNTLLLSLALSLSSLIVAQEKEAEKSAYQFETSTDVPHTAVKSQYRSGTCWSFAGLGFLEAELLRMTGKTYDLSEMFLVKYVYAAKTKKYVRLHGKLNYGPGGGFSDMFYVVDNFGIVPESVYDGLVIGEENHVHGEMDAVLQAYADAVIKNKNGKLTPVWQQGMNGILDAYLGEVPDQFEFNGQTMTPIDFMKQTNFQSSDYIELASFTHVPYYKPFVMLIPDNWMWSESYNLPLNEMMETIDNALEKGYTVGWDADVSDKGFGWKKGVAIVPEQDLSKLPEQLSDSLKAMTKAERTKYFYSFETIVQEQEITPEIRQMAYENYETTDDHLMMIVGSANDQLGNKYYRVKNSWGHEDHIYGGYCYASEAFVAYKTLSILINKEGLPKKTQDKLKL
ncbi:MAG: C1 family peptidase [Bacteroidales bacterium]|jgi:bleomycin hydrolase|nr:C1 family peptidase [Bacteroidales bacterium]